MVKDCEALLIELSPEKKMEAQQIQEISSLRSELAELKKLLLASSEQNKKTE